MAGHALGKSDTLCFEGVRNTGPELFSKWPPVTETCAVFHFRGLLLQSLQIENVIMDPQG